MLAPDALRMQLDPVALDGKRSCLACHCLHLTSSFIIVAVDVVFDHCSC